MAIVPDSMLGIVTETVTDKLRDFETLSNQYNSLLSSSLAKIADIDVKDVAEPQRLNAPDAPTPAFDKGAIPSFKPSSLAVPPLPSMQEIGGLLADLDIDVDWDLPDRPDMPVISLPDAPSLGGADLPKRPDVDADFPIPDAPDLVLPDMEPLSALNLPDFVFPELPDFNGNPPSADGIFVPDVFLNWKEPEYKSVILDDLTAQVKAMMRGGTGIPSVIENALFARTRERDSAETERAVSETVQAWAARGFSLPQGVLDA